jgi:hypothetical protein
VRTALGSLPWVDKDSIDTDVTTKLVAFNTTDTSRYSEQDLRQALRDEGYPVVHVKRGPH